MTSNILYPQDTNSRRYQRNPTTMEQFQGAGWGSQEQHQQQNQQWEEWHDWQEQQREQWEQQGQQWQYQWPWHSISTPNIEGDFHLTCRGRRFLFSNGVIRRYAGIFYELVSVFDVRPCFYFSDTSLTIIESPRKVRMATASSTSPPSWSRIS